MDKDTSRNLALGLTSTSLVIGTVVTTILVSIVGGVLVGLIGLIIIAGLSQETKR
jgi:hypothetical protein